MEMPLTEATHISQSDTVERQKYCELLAYCASGEVDKVVSFFDYYRLDKSAAENFINNQQFGPHRWTALMVATYSCDRIIVEDLLRRGACCYQVNIQGFNSLMLAARKGDLGVLKAINSMGHTCNHSCCGQLSNHDNGNLLVQTVNKTFLDIFSPTNNYGNTCLMIAVAEGHLDSARYIINLRYGDYSQLAIENQFGKCALMIAAEFGRFDIVQYLVNNCNQNVNMKNLKGRSPLHLACSGSSMNHYCIAEFLVNQGSHIGRETWFDGEGSTPLTFAIINAEADSASNKIIEFLLERLSTLALQISNENFIDHVIKSGARNGLTPLMLACQRGDDNTVKMLLKYKASRWICNETNNNNRRTAFEYALMCGHPKLSYDNFVVNEIDGYSMVISKVREIFDKDEIILIHTKYLNNLKAMEELAICGAHHDLYFSILIEIIPKLGGNCIDILNKSLTPFFRELANHSTGDNGEQLTRSLRSDSQFLLMLFKLRRALGKLKTRQPSETDNLHDRISEIDVMIGRLVLSDGMDTMEHQQMSFLCGLDNLNPYTYHRVNQAQAFLAGPLEEAVSEKIIHLFTSPSVAKYIDSIFWHTLRPPKRIEGPAALLIDSMGSNLFIKARYCPALMFIFDGLSQLLALVLVTYVNAFKYRSSNFDEETNRMEVTFSEGFLICICFSTIVYELGEFTGNSASVFGKNLLQLLVEYFSNIWNFFDFGSIVFLILWIWAKFDVSVKFDLAKLFLGLAAVFQSMGLLRFLMLYVPFGKLIILIYAMTFDLGSFAVVFLVSIFGFCVFFYSLFAGNTEPGYFSSPGEVFFTLFNAALGSYDPFNVIFNEDVEYRIVGILTLMLYILISAIILLNLVVARMTASHDEMAQKSFQALYHGRAETITRYLLLYELNSFCMLPVPFNLLTFILAPFHNLAITWQNAKLNSASSKDRKKKAFSESHSIDQSNEMTSLTGAAADIIIGILFWPLMTILEAVHQLDLWGNYFLSKDNPIKKEKLFSLIDWDWKWDGKPADIFALILLLMNQSIVLLPISTLVTIIFYNLHDFNRTKFRIEKGYRGKKMLRIIYELQSEVIEKPVIVESDKNNISVKVLQASHNPNNRDDRWKGWLKGKDWNEGEDWYFTVKIRLGKHLLSTGQTLNPGGNPSWFKSLMFSIRPEELENNLKVISRFGHQGNMFFEIYGQKSRLSAHGDGKLLGQCGVDINDWIACEGFEGQILLKGKRMSWNLSLFVKIKFDNYFRHASLYRPLLDINPESEIQSDQSIIQRSVNFRGSFFELVSQFSSPPKSLFHSVLPEQSSSNSLRDSDDNDRSLFAWTYTKITRSRSRSTVLPSPTVGSPVTHPKHFSEGTTDTADNKNENKYLLRHFASDKYQSRFFMKSAKNVGNLESEIFNAEDKARIFEWSKKSM